MTKEWNEELFRKWIKLRNELKSYKKEKNWQNIICVCEKIIQLDKQAGFIRIMISLFYKEMANAYEKIGDINNSLKYFYTAKECFLRYRNENELSNPNDWFSDINNIDKKISKLSQKKEKLS